MPIRPIARGVAALALSALALGGAPTPVAAEPWDDPAQPALQRADTLLAAMTFDQKVALALGDWPSVASLGIPALNWADGPNGVRAPGTTAFPSAQALASTFDDGLARAFGEAAATEARAKGFNWWLAPALDIARTPLSGRQPENLGEDPFLAGHTAAAEVAGARRAHVVATLKHYVVNNQEFERFGFQVQANPFARGPAIDVRVSPRALQEIYAAPFKTAIHEGGAASVMCSYNRVNGEQACQSASLLGDLKDSGLQGFVVPDFLLAVRDPLAAANAGVDVPGLDPPAGRTAQMFTSGDISAARLDDIVRRILFAMFASGVFDHPLPASPAPAATTPAHAGLADRIARAGTVLLKNASHTLPLSAPRLRSIAVIGPAGGDAQFVNGGSAAVPLAAQRTVTPLAGIAARAGAHVTINTAQGSLGDVHLPAAVPSGLLAPASGTGPGLRAEYWSNADLAGPPELTRVEPTLDVSSPPEGVGPVWSARWSGMITPTESGLHRLSLLQAGIARLYVDGRLVASGYREAIQFLDGPHYPIQAAVRLTAGKPVALRVEYTSKAQLFGAQIRLAWQPPSGSGIAAAVDAARRSDAAIVFVNNAQGEGMDRSTLALPGDQDELVAAVAAANRRTIVVLNTGGPVLMPWLRDVGAVLSAWYPGERFGSAIAAVLFGDADPGGRLPVTFPAGDDDGPAPVTRPQRYPGVDGVVRYDEGILVGYRWFDAVGQRPLFPFGHGLSYARFRFSKLRVDEDRADGSLRVSVRVTNVGRRRGSTIAQLYLASPAAANAPPRQLKGYAKLELDPGEMTSVTLRLKRGDLAYFDARTSAWTVADGRHTVFVGSSSRELPLRRSFQVAGSG